MKKQFEVQDNETIDQCLERIKREGYTVIQRIEKPIFREEIKDNEVIYVPVKQKIIFQALKSEQ